MENLLERLGLTLSPEKTRVVNLQDTENGFDFLGYHYRWYPSRWKLLMQNILDATPNALQEELYPRVRAILDAPDMDTARLLLEQVLESYGRGILHTNMDLIGEDFSIYQ